MDACLVLHYILELNPAYSNLVLHLNHVVMLFNSYDIQRQICNLKLMLILVKNYEKTTDSVYKEAIKKIYNITLTNYNNWTLERIANYDPDIEYTTILKYNSKYSIRATAGLLNDSFHKITVQHGQLIKEITSGVIFMYNGINDNWIYKNRMYKNLDAIPLLSRIASVNRIYKIKSYNSDWY